MNVVYGKTNHHMTGMEIIELVSVMQESGTAYLTQG
jgi:hypothetical protein